MNYHNISGWKKAEKSGNSFEALSLLLKELKFNCDQIPKDHPKRELAQFIYYSVATKAASTDVPFNALQELLTKVKEARKEIKDIIRDIK